MIKKYIKSNNGATLVLVLVTLSILSMLGAAIISLSLINFKMKVVDNNVKTSFYLAEAGLHEAYAVIGKSIETGIDEGNSKVETELATFIQNERILEQTDPIDEESEYILGTDGYGEIDEEKIMLKIEEWFKEGYSKYINDNLEDTLNNKVLSKADENISDEIAEINIIGSVTEYDITGGQENYIVTLKSDFEDRNVEKQMQATFTIKIPSYNAPYYVTNNVIQMPTNVLWKKAITSEKDIIIRGNNVSIKGDVYAYGTKPGDSLALRDYGGIIAGDKSLNQSGKITVEGSVVTSSYVHTNYNDSSIDIEGDVFANSLIIQEDTNRCNIIVEGTVNTRDDVEINGEEGTIDIEGSYYGFSDGSTVSASHDNSSSIVINSPDIGDSGGSKLKITGVQTSDEQIDNPDIGNDLYTGGVFIGGTVYIDVTGGPYQTGESVSIKGNYKAYGEYLDDDLSLYNSNGGPRDDVFDPTNTIMDSYPPLVLVDGLNVIEKSKYFNYYDEDYGSDSVKKLKLGGAGIEIDNLLFSTGATIRGGTVNESKALLDSSDIINKKANDFNYMVNKMGDNKYGNPQGLMNTNRVCINNGSGNGRFKFSDSVNSYPNETDVNNRRELLYINNDDDKDLAIIGTPDIEAPKSISKETTITLNDENLMGIIITKGDIYISGKINYRGIIVTEGNIYFEDDNPKNITHDMDYILKKIAKLDGTDGSINLKDEFANNNTNELQSVLYESSAGVDDINTYIKYDDIIDIYWEKIK